MVALKSIPSFNGEKPTSQQQNSRARPFDHFQASEARQWKSLKVFGGIGRSGAERSEGGSYGSNPVSI